MDKLTPSDQPYGQGFGQSVSISDNVAIVAAPYDHSNGLPYAGGAAYIFRFDGSHWIEEQKLTSPNPTFGEQLGPVAVCGDFVVIGSPKVRCGAESVESNCGVAYVYQFDGFQWVSQYALRAPQQRGLVFYGSSVECKGDLLAVGAVDQVYIYRHVGAIWALEQELPIAPGAWASNFDSGRTLAIGQDLLVVGNPPGPYPGSAFVFRFNHSTWLRETELTPPFPAASQSFGRRLGLDGNTLIVAAAERCVPNGGHGCGAAYVFHYDSGVWNYVQKLSSDKPNDGDFFAGPVAVGQDIAIIGAELSLCVDDRSGARCGAAFVFRYNGSSWVLDQKFVGSDAILGSDFGSRISLNDGIAIVGARGNCTPTAFCGAAYVFALGPDCNDNGQADFCDIRDGESNDGDADGVPDECEPQVALDIKPGACPNPFNPRSRGVTSAVLIGSATFDVSQVDTGTLTLARADGVGGSIKPLSGPPGPGMHIGDSETFISTAACECPQQGADGFDDLSIKFSTSDMVQVLQLNSSGRSSIALTARGVLHDGTSFAATDCILITGSSVMATSMKVAEEVIAPPHRAGK